MARTLAQGLYTPGATGANATVPDSAALSITGDIDIITRVSAATYFPATNQTIVSKASANTAANGGFIFSVVASTGVLRLSWINAAGTLLVTSSTSGITAIDSSPVWLRATMDVNDGSGNRVTKFYTSSTSTSDPASVVWTQLGTTVTTAGNTDITNGASAMEIGTVSGGTANLFNGLIYRAIVKNGYDGAGSSVFDADFASQAVGTTSFSESINGATVTINGTARIYGRAISTTRSSVKPGLYLPGIAGNYASTPDSAVLSITGDITLACKVQLADWTPGSAIIFLAKNNNSPDRSYHLTMTTNKFLRFTWSTNGTNSPSEDSTDSLPFIDGDIGYVGASLDVNNGSGGRDTKFWYSLEGLTWEQLGDTVTTAATTSIFNSAAPLEIGSAFSGTSSLWAGQTYWVRVYSGIHDLSTGTGGTLVFNADLTVPTFGETTMAETANNATVTVFRTGNPTASFTRRSFATPYLYLPGVTGNYASAPDSAATSITGDQDIIFRAQYIINPFASGYYVGKYLSAGNQRSWRLGLNTSGSFVWIDSALGTADTYNNTLWVASATLSHSVTYWFRLRIDVDNGFNQRQITISYAPDKATVPTSWTTGATLTTQANANTFDSNVPLEIGAFGGGTTALKGAIYRVILKDGHDGTTAFDADFTVQTPGASSFTESSANAATVTINTSGSHPNIARIAGRKLIV